MSESAGISVDASGSGVRRVFGVFFVVAYLLALLPPIYIGMTKLHDVVLGLPISVWYPLLDCLFALGLCIVLYVYESAREELD
ncbi:MULTISPECIES: hypothetical protein [Streptomyces]|uniref:Uncharacterized protein n=1 Tax=Streptomyces mordarskii TaxID=1226758 RepID=A0ABN1C8N5_9ACTN|nr:MULTISPECIES: hypothetical protein [Streptomyces]QTI88292.1 hypothetical protein AS97_46760 [Streptomyces sp. AgN23]RSS45082.1 hypothetical protein EF902_14810 [Streptomyces sp. WAC05858]WTA80602.1 hypothetical protein OG751_12155 [Streptomyces antimycoticus]WTB09193.1 hypothetical protein OG546_36330 [Streptomyces antimycoticus]